MSLTRIKRKINKPVKAKRNPHRSALSLSKPVKGPFAAKNVSKPKTKAKRSPARRVQVSKLTIVIG